MSVARDDARSRMAGVETGFVGVVAGDVLRGLTLPCAAPLVFLLDADADGGPRAAALSLRLLAGVVRPRVGKVFALGVDPASDPDRRREIALLGDPVLLDPTLPLREAANELSSVRGIDHAELPDGPDDLTTRRQTSDALANVEHARLVLVSHPEQYADPAERDALLAGVRRALDRGAQVVVATSSLDEVLSLASTPDAFAAVIARGTVAVAGPAHGLPWAAPVDGVSTRLIRVVLGVSEGDDGTVPPAARLAADLLTDAGVARHVAMVETVGPLELRIQARDPRTLSRAIAARAHDGLPVRHLAVHGAAARVLAATWGGR